MAKDEHLEVWPGHFAEFMALPLDHPIDMLNLIRFRGIANYPKDHVYAAKALTGEEAFQVYTRTSFPSFVRAGGIIVWSGTMESMMIGPITERWNLAFVARYPSREAFLASLADPEYKLAVIHRQAALETSRLLCLKAVDPRAG